MENSFYMLTTPLAGSYFPFQQGSVWRCLENGKLATSLPIQIGPCKYRQSVLDSNVCFAVAKDIWDNTWARRIA